MKRCGSGAARKRRTISASSALWIAKSRRLFSCRKLVEHVGRQHQRRRHGDPHAGKLLRHAALVQQMAHEGQAARLAAQRAAADPKKESVRRLETWRG